MFKPYHRFTVTFVVLLIFCHLTCSQLEDESFGNKEYVSDTNENVKPLRRIKEINVIKIIYEDDSSGRNYIDSNNGKRKLSVKEDNYKNKENPTNGRRKLYNEDYSNDPIDKKEERRRPSNSNNSNRDKFDTDRYNERNNGPNSGIPAISKDDMKAFNAILNTISENNQVQNQNSINDNGKQSVNFNVVHINYNTNEGKTAGEDTSGLRHNDEIIFPESQNNEKNRQIKNTVKTTETPSHQNSNQHKSNADNNIGNSKRFETKPTVANFDSNSPNVGFARENRRPLPVDHQSNLFDSNKNNNNRNNNILENNYINEKPNRNKSINANRLEKLRDTSSSKKQKRRLCDTKYAEYIKIIYPEEEDTAEDAIEQDFDGRLLAAPGEYPHMTAIGFETEVGVYDYKCGGSLISEYFVITAAHCANVSGQSPSKARIGDLNLKINEMSVQPQTRDIRKIHIHPEYNENLHYNDIALVELSRSITFSESVRPIRLWTQTDTPFPTVFAMGYGSTAFGKPLTNILTYLNLTIVPNEECQRLLPAIPEAPQGIVSSQICAHDYLMKRDTCQGDSGGPLQYTLKGKRQNKREHYLLLGIISYGLYCRSDYPSVYTRVSSYLDWIEETVWE